MQDDVENFPITYIPNSDSAYGGRNASEKIKNLYVTLLWLSLPLVALTRYKVGTRYISTVNILCSFFLLLSIGYQLSLASANFSIPFLTELFPQISLGWVFFFSVIFTIILARIVLAQIMIFSICAFLSFFASSDSLHYMDVTTVLIITHIIAYVRSLISKRYNQHINSYFYGKPAVNLIIGNESFTLSAIIEGLLLFFVVPVPMAIILVYLPVSLKGNFGNITILLIIISFANVFIAIMQSYSIRQYQRDLSDSQIPANKSKKIEDFALKAHRVKPVR